jgi:hypothetical protein
VGAALRNYQRRHGLGIQGLAAWLGLGTDDLSRLAAARAPDRGSPGFAREVRRLTEIAGGDVVRLVVVLTEPKTSGSTAVGNSRSRSA